MATYDLPGLPHEYAAPEPHLSGVNRRPRWTTIAIDRDDVQARFDAARDTHSSLTPS